LETQLKTARDKVAHLYARWHELELMQSVPSPWIAPNYPQHGVRRHRWVDWGAPVVTARIDRFIAEGGKGPYPNME
jgi:hypothetical protein